VHWTRGIAPCPTVTSIVPKEDFLASHEVDYETTLKEPEESDRTVDKHSLELVTLVRSSKWKHMLKSFDLGWPTWSYSLRPILSVVLVNQEVKLNKL
jgi:hypothetical protein